MLTTKTDSLLLNTFGEKIGMLTMGIVFMYFLIMLSSEAFYRFKKRKYDCALISLSFSILLIGLNFAVWKYLFMSIFTM